MKIVFQVLIMNRDEIKKAYEAGKDAYCEKPGD